jgi:hypothetical protein
MLRRLASVASVLSLSLLLPASTAVRPGLTCDTWTRRPLGIEGSSGAGRVPIIGVGNAPWLQW